MTVINTNVSALYANAALANNAAKTQQVMQQLSTGKRINTASDDAAGLAISSRMTSQIHGLNQAIRNANDAISMVQTAEGATDTITNMLQRMRELAVQAGNASNSSDDKTAIASEYNALVTETDRIASTTKWNGFTILAGSTGSGNSFDFFVDAGSSSVSIVTVTLGGFNTGSSASIALTASDLTSATTASGAQTLLGTIDTNIAYVNARRSAMGAVINRFQYTVDNLTNVSSNISASRSRILDTDYSTATAELSRNNIIQQAATAMLAQANQQPQLILQLLK